METNRDKRRKTPPITYAKSTSAFVFTVLKKVTVVSLIYLSGYMNWSVAWLLTPIILSETRHFLTDTNNVVRRKIAKASAQGSERAAILACVADLPSWVYFPDFERCEWINQILQQLWPYVDEFFSVNLIKTKLEPKIRKALSKKKLHGFTFDSNRIILGTTPIRIGGVKVHDMNTSRDEIILDVDLIFASDCSINFRLAGIPAAFNDFEIYGKIRVILKPLISKAPFFGAVQILFLDNPDIDFNLAGPAEISNIPGLRDILRRVIAKKITKKMVAPNKVTKKLSKEVSAAAVKMHEPEAVLRIHVAEAKNLIKQDIGILGGKSDPYVVVTIGAQQFRTNTIHDNLNPVWNFWCEALIEVKSQTPIQFHTFDWDRTGGDDPLGSVHVDINDIRKSDTLDTWYTLHGVDHGELRVRFAWYELSSSSTDLAAALAETSLLGNSTASSAVLCVFIDSACDLPRLHPDTEPDPFATLTVCNTERFTSVKRDTNAPVWEQGFTFLVTNPFHDTLQIQIIGQTHSKRSGECLGQLIYSLSDLLTHSDLKNVLQDFQLKGPDTKSKVKLSMTLKILKRSGTNTLEPIRFVGKNKSKLQSQPSQSESCTSEEDAGRDKVLTRSKHQLSPDTAMGLGSIKLTLYYSAKTRVLSVTIHKIVNIPIKDPSDMPDPYVTLYLLPKRSKETRRKTIVVKNSCDPVYETTFEYGSIAPNELKTLGLEVTVKTKLTFLIGGGLTIGMARIKLDKDEMMEKMHTDFYDLMREMIVG